jgi:hypothetical protein
MLGVVTSAAHCESTDCVIWIVVRSSSRLVTQRNWRSGLKAGLAGNNRPLVLPFLTPLKSPSLAMALPLGRILAQLNGPQRCPHTMET